MLQSASGSHVFLVTFDALRQDVLGVYGGPLGVSPHLDAFAQSAVIFDNATSSAPVTPTSFAAAMTSRHPHESFRSWKMSPLPTLAQAFRDAGYRTIGVFNNAQLNEERHFDRGFDDFRVFKPRTSDREALDVARRLLAGVQDEKVFFWLHFNSPHAPYDRREIAEDLYDPAYDGPYEETSTAVFQTTDPTDRDRLYSLYLGEVRWVDSLFQEWIDLLADRQFQDTSVVVVSSDHGEEFGERGTYQHRHLHRETLSIPLLIRLPRQRESIRTTLPIASVDLWPTLAEIVEIAPPETSDGTAVWQHQRPSHASILSVAMTDPQYLGVSLVDDGGKKVLMTCRPQRVVSLYDLSEDPWERTADRTLARAEGRQLIGDLRSRFSSHPCRAIDEAIAGADPTAGLDAATIRGLRALGYLSGS